MPLAPTPPMAPVPNWGPLAAHTGILREEGEGTNNIGELWAVGMALELLKWEETHSGSPHTGPIYIFTDSQLIIALLTYRACPKINHKLVHRVRAALYQRNLTNQVHLYWVAGHVGVHGNELADQQAERGSSQAAEGVGLWEQNTLNHQSTMLPINQEPFNLNESPP